MRISRIVIGLIAGLSFALPASADKDAGENAIKARQAQMQLRVFNARPLFAIAKGDMPYDAEMVTMLANNLKVLQNLNNGRAWMQGTSTEDYPGKTKALAGIWESDSNIGDRGESYTKAVNELAEVADQGLEEVRPRIVDLGDACKSCHDDYREED